MAATHKSASSEREQCRLADKLRELAPHWEEHLSDVGVFAHVMKTSGLAAILGGRHGATAKGVEDGKASVHGSGPRKPMQRHLAGSSVQRQAAG